MASDNGFSIGDEQEIINEVDKVDRNVETMDFSSGDEEEMIREVERVDRKKYECDICNKTYQQRGHISRHKLSHTFHVQCSVCSRSFRRKDLLKRHMKNVHGTGTFPCNHCADVYDTYTDLINHVERQHPLSHNQPNQPQAANHQPSSSSATIADNPVRSSSTTVNTSNQSALNNTASIITMQPHGSDQNDLLSFLANIRLHIRDYLKTRVLQHGIKWYLCLQIELERFNGNGENNLSRPHFRSRTYILLNQETYNEHELKEALQKIVESLEKFMRNGSG